MCRHVAAILLLCDNPSSCTTCLTKENKMTTEVNDVSKEKLIAGFKEVIADAEELLRATASQAGDKATEVRARIQVHLADAKIRLADAEAAVVDRAKQVGRAADDYVHDNPWRSVGIAAGFGLIVGLLIGRR
jgi:ElaB/YqjD/DUF883 family membrane-anchored ribosome-binding protein